MRLEYFQLIDRIVDLNLDDRTIRVEANVPTDSTIFEGHFPGYPLMPGVLLIEAMAQTSGWLVIALTEFTRMPFLAAVKEAKLRTFVTPGQTLSVVGQARARRLRLRDDRGRDHGRRQAGLQRRASRSAWSISRTREFRASMEEVAARIGFPMEALAHG